MSKKESSHYVIKKLFAKLEKTINLMSSESDKTLENYLQKLMEIRYRQQPEQILNEKNLKDIALEAGLTEEEYELSRKRAMDYLSRGKAYLASFNWMDAAHDLEQAAILMPHSAEANLLAGKAFMRKGSATNTPQDLQKADYFLNRSIAISPVDNEAMTLKAELNRQRDEIVQRTEKKVKSSEILRWGIGAAVIILIVLWIINIQNTMVEAEEQTINAWAQVENVYQRRADLIPNLVKTVQAAADFERETLNDVIRARAAITSIQINPTELNEANLNAFIERQETLSASLGRLLAVAENYPQLQSMGSFRDLQSQIEGAENRITVERRRYNEKVQVYNSLARRFPYRLFGFVTKPYFTTDKRNMETPDIQFN
jgi:LemA protein